MHQNERTGLGFALGAFGLISIGDAMNKAMAGHWPVTAISASRYTFGAVLLGAILWWREGRAGFSFARPGWQLLRGLSIGGSMLAFVGALSVMPLASATAISFTSPMITALLAALLLGEPARRETWIASVVAFVGVMIVLRPNFEALGWFAILPLISATGMALLMIGNRAVAGHGSATAMQFNLTAVAAAGLIPVALLGHFSGIPAFRIAAPPTGVVVTIAVVTCTASTAHWLLYQATVRAGAGTIAPMTYVQLLGAIGLGLALFGERPDATALLGASIIVAAGLYLWSRGRVRDLPRDE